MNKINSKGDCLSKKLPGNHFLRIMRISIILLFTCVFCSMAESAFTQNAKVTINKRNSTIKEVLNEIEAQTDYLFIYNNEVNTDKKVSVRAKSESVKDVLNDIFKGTDIRYSMEGNHIILFVKSEEGFAKDTKALVVQQQRVVSGKVTDQNGDPLPGATVMIKGTTQGTITDADGNYSLSNVPDDATLVFSFVGMQTQEIKVDNQTRIDVTMQEESVALEEVVAIGYGVQRKVTLTGSVAAVDNKDIVVTKNENVVNALAGKLPGVRITQKSAAPGAYDTRMDIRGLGDPLYVIDGVPRDQGYFARMSPEEIESISILKDASAAIYGMRASNGVVLVTTKRGIAQEGKVDIIFNANYSFQQFIRVPKGVSAQDYMTLRNEQNWQDFHGNYLVRRTPVFTQDQIQPYLEGKPSYDWMGAVFNNTVPQQQYNLSINGGNERLNYFFNLAYNKQDGSYKSDDYYSERWNVRSNIDAQITNRLKARISVGAILPKTTRPNGTGWSTYKNTWLLRPDAPIYANDNPNYPNGDSGILYDGHNMVVETNSDFVGYNVDKERRLNGTLQLTYDIPGIKGLSVKGLYDYTMNLPDYTQYHRSFNLYIYNPDTDTYTSVQKEWPSNVRRQANYSNDTDFQLGMYYNNKFDDHNINSFFLFEEVYNTWDSFAAYRELMINSKYLFAGEDKNQQATGGGIGDRTIQSFIGSFSYDYKSKYIVDFKFRYDGSSRFPKGSRWGFFPSILAGWRISEENFVKNNLTFLNNLKLRASYGEMGDDSSAGNYPPTTGYGIDNNRGWFFGGVLSGGVSPQSIPNPNLTWYTSKMYNVGLDFGVLQNKLSGTLDFFKRDRSGLLATSASVIPGTVGASLPQENLNSDRTFGWEASLEYRDKVGDFNYYVSPQISAAKNKRTHWIETPASNSYDKWRNRTSGRYTDIWWGNEITGVFTSYEQIRGFELPVGQGTLPGDGWLEDWNGDGVIDGNDYHPIATYGLPVFNYGISLGGSWKDFDLYLNFQGASGVYAQYAEALTEFLPFGGQNTMSWFMDRWHPLDPDADYFNPNTKWIPGKYPVAGHNGPRTGIDMPQNTSYLRLKTLEVGYTLPKNLVSKIGVKNLRLYFSGYNLLTFSKLKILDPERPGASGGASSDYIDFYNYPNNCTYTLGASIQF